MLPTRLTTLLGGPKDRALFELRQPTRVSARPEQTVLSPFVIIPLECLRPRGLPGMCACCGHGVLFFHHAREVNRSTRLLKMKWPRASLKLSCERHIVFVHCVERVGVTDRLAGASPRVSFVPMLYIGQDRWSDLHSNPARWSMSRFLIRTWKGHQGHPGSKRTAALNAKPDSVHPLSCQFA